ncbi:PqqD family protein [Salidesulfovibrio brasiliensis]|uniref:PqqD family protein n=1 Tax=Salidesulfovibrio brasiliensis TaxID=221711 RepID=UPI0006D1F782|nr:PqqD family protein [Salidesulfovibrio brasiliensis]
MAFFRRKTRPKPEFDRERAMGMIPVRNHGVRQETTADGQVQLAYEAMVRPWFAGPAEKLGLWDGKPMTKRVELDAMGRFVWERVDGKHSVRAIAEAFCERYGVLQEEAELSVASFMRMLGERGIIAIRED